MSNGDRPADAAKNLVPSPARQLRGLANSRYPIGHRQQGVTPHFLLHVLLTWWKIAIPAGLLMVAVSIGIVCWVFEPQYEATTWLKIKSHQPYLAFAPSQSEQGGGDRFVQTQVEMIRSEMVLSPVTSQPEAADVPELKEEEDATGWLARHIRVSPVGESELFRISLACANAEDSAWIVNAVAHEYLLLLGQSESERSQEVINTLKEERSDREAEVKRLRDSLRELSKQITGEDPFSPVSAGTPDSDRSLTDLSSGLVRAEVEQMVLAANIASLEAELAKERVEPPTELIEAAIDQDPQIQQQQNQIALIQIQLRELESTLVSPEKNSRFNDLQRLVRENEQHLEEARNDAREQIEAREAISHTTKLQDKLAAMKSQFQGQQTIEKMLRDRYEQKLSETKSLSGDTLELHRLQDDLAKAEGVYDVLSERILRMTTEQRAPDQVMLLRPATAAVVPVEKVPWSGIAMSCLLVFVPISLAGAWEFMIRRVSDMQQLEESTNVAVVGEVARFPVRSKGSLNGSKASSNLGLAVFEESIDGLRTHLMLSEELAGMKVLAVTSAASHEGKTSVAAQLAVNMAWVSGKRTLLIDGDMRSPDVHNVFGIPREPGLAEVLTKDCSAMDAIVRNEENYTDVLPAGKLRTNPHRLLGNGVLESLIEKARADYDHIIIDTPPILAASESLVLARVADRSLLCAMKDSSRIDQVRKAHERLIKAGGNPIGIVLNGVPTKSYLYRYGSYAYSHD